MGDFTEKIADEDQKCRKQRIARLGPEIEKGSIHSIGVPCLHYGLPALERTLGGISRGRSA